MPYVELGQPLEGQEERNPWGWVLIASTLGFMLVVALGGYFSADRAAETVKSQAEVQLKTAMMFSGSVSAQLAQSASGNLGRYADDLRPYIAKDPEAALLYGEIRIESHQSIAPSDLTSLQKSKDPLHRSAFEILTASKLQEGRARQLAASIPQTKFSYKLLRVEALEKGGVANARDSLVGDHPMVWMLVVGGGLLTACGLGAVLLVAYVISRTSHRLQPKGIPLDALSPPDADRLALRCGQFFFLFIAAQIVVGFAVRGSLNREWADIPVYVLIILGILALSRVPVGGKWITLRTLGVRSENVGRDVMWGIAAAAANVPIIAVVAVVSNALFKNLPQAEHPVEFEIQGTGSALVILKLVIVACVFAPFIEEIIFRASLFPALNGVWQRLVAAGIVSSLAFGMIHPTGIPAWLPLATIGGMSCFLTYQTRSIVPSMVMHGIHNFVTLLFSLAILR